MEFESHFFRYRNFIREATWKEDPESGTGTLFNLGSHLIDQTMILFGKPEYVTADMRIMRSGGRIDDSFELWLRYPDIKVSVCGSYLAREAGPRYILHGTEGSFLKWGFDPQEGDLDSGKLPTDKDWGQESSDYWGILNTTIDGKNIRKKYKSLAGNYQIFYDNIYAAIRKGAPLLVSAEQAGMVIRVIEAAYESVRTMRAIKV